MNIKVELGGDHQEGIVGKLRVMRVEYDQSTAYVCLKIAYQIPIKILKGKKGT
jgi:hypothetical protein